MPSDAPKPNKLKLSDVKETAQSVESGRHEQPGVAGACTCTCLLAFGSKCVARVTID